MRKVLAIIPAAGKPNNRVYPSYSNLPDCMIAVNGKPVIGHILDDLLERGCASVRLLLNPEDKWTEKYAAPRYREKLNLDFVYVASSEGGLMSTIHAGSLGLRTEDCEWGLLIYLGDTLYKGQLEFEQDFLVVSKEWEDPNKWCFVENPEWRFAFVNKPETYHNGGKALCGLYFFLNAEKFAEITAKNKNGELSELLEDYRSEWNLVEAEGWYDFGNVENYYRAKVDLLRLRHFNEIKYDERRGTVTKTSTKKEKIRDEALWYAKMPDDLKIFSPRLVDYDVWENPWYTLEYYGYPNLADLYLFGHLHVNVWKSVLDKLFDTLLLFHSHAAPGVTEEDFRSMYYEKTVERLKELRSQGAYDKILNLPIVRINGKEYENAERFLEKIHKSCGALAAPEDATFMHWDFCFSNILYDVNSRIIKSIDPRGSFGKKGVYGDSKYDAAKIRHSVIGNYDFIVSDLFDCEYDGAGNFELMIHSEPIHSEVSRMFDDRLSQFGFDVEKVKLIEALLFLSMIPLHSDKPKRQLAMYCQAVIKLNGVDFTKIA